MLSWTFWRLLDLEPVDPVASPRDKASWVKTTVIDVGLRDQFVNAPTALKICECPMSFIGGSRPIQRMPSRKDTDFLILGRNLTLKIRKIKRPYPPRECVFPSVGAVPRKADG